MEFNKWFTEGKENTVSEEVYLSVCDHDDENESVHKFDKRLPKIRHGMLDSVYDEHQQMQCKAIRDKRGELLQTTCEIFTPEEPRVAKVHHKGGCRSDIEKGKNVNFAFFFENVSGSRPQMPLWFSPDEWLIKGNTI